MGEHHYVRTAFHGPGDLSPIGFSATVHVDLTVPNFGIQELTEHEKQHGDPLGDVFQGGAAFVPGDRGVDVPGELGLGIDVDIDAAREYEYERSHLPSPRNPDGSVQDW
jgi:mannonate dehydratase